MGNEQGAAKKRAVVLLSGGLDSTTTLAIAARDYDVFALTFDYGQKHTAEIEAARSVAKAQGVVQHFVARFDSSLLAGSALTSPEVEIPKDRSPSEVGGPIPVTYVPARNTIFLSFALAWAEGLGADDIFIGVNAIDYSGYPDCRPEFIEAFERMANLATKAGVEEKRRLAIHTPLIELTKAQIIERGLEMGVDYGLTVTCYDPGPRGEPCGRCDACLLRAQGFRELGLEDPATRDRR
jgi:7-cyano-7-deazaguanine synthase